MAIRFIEIKPADSVEQLNTEWVILTNDGKLPLHTAGVGMMVGRRGSAKKYMLGIIIPGFVLHPGASVRMCTGHPALDGDYGDQGAPPTDEVANYFLLRSKAYIKEPHTMLTLTLRGTPIAKGEFDPTHPRGVHSGLA